jgi:hypothetical protein
MMRKNNLLAFSLIALSLTQAQGQSQDLDLSNALQEFRSNTLQVNFSARILAADEKPVWNVESTKLTIPGRSVRVRLDGDNVRIYLICTPYMQADGEILLLAQGQIWFTEPPEEKVKYFSPFYSIPVSLGEKVLFFPLGVSGEPSNKDFFNIEMQIQIVPYNEKSTQDNASHDASSAQDNATPDNE